MNNYSEMLFDSAKLVHQVLTNPKKYTTEECKMIIAGANTLAQTTKMAIQHEILKVRLHNAKLNTTQIVHELTNENNSMER